MIDAPNYHNATFPEPRPFQVTAHAKLREGARAGHKRQMLMSSTGSGKTFLGLQVIHEALKKGHRCMFICNRQTLINQTSAVADRYGLSAHSVLMADHHRYDKHALFQIASIQTLMRREWPQVDVIVLDEGHYVYKAWIDHLMKFDGHVLALSATPFTKGLGRIYTNLVNASNMHELTESGVLVPLKVYSCTRINMEDAETAGGEWTDASAGQRGTEIVGDVVAEWLQYAPDKKTIVFGASIEHCEEMCRQFNEAGIYAACYTSRTPDAERLVLLDEYRKRDAKIRVLISVEALAAGFDVPDVGCVCDCRPLRKSLSLFIQMIGRGLRASPDTGKTSCTLLDFSGNIVRFAEDFSDIFYHGLDTLDAGERLDKTIRRDKNDEPEGKKCPACGFQPFAKRCIACGHASSTHALIERVPGQMQEIVIGKRKMADDNLHLWEQVCTYAKGNGNPDTAARRAWYLFKDIAGYELPKGMPKFTDVYNVQITRPVINAIKAKNIAYAKAMQRQSA